MDTTISGVRFNRDEQMAELAVFLVALEKQGAIYSITHETFAVVVYITGT